MTMTIPSVGRRIRILALAGVSALMTWAGTSAASRETAASDTLTAREAFVRLPVDVLDLLDRSTRLDMLDYADADSVWNATNTLGGISRLTDLAPDYLRVEVTRVSTLELKVLPVARGRIVMTLYTVGDPDNAPDTEMRFFDGEMKPLDTDRYFRMPPVRDFLDIPRGTDVNGVLERIPFPTTVFEVSPGGDTMTGHLTLGSGMPREDYDTVAPMVRPALTWRWDGRRWQPVR